MLEHEDEQDIEDCDVSISPDKYLAWRYPNKTVKQEPVSPSTSQYIKIEPISPERILAHVNTAKTNVKVETSFDSGYCSPTPKHSKMDNFPPLGSALQISPLKIENEMSMCKDGIMQEMSSALYDDINISEGWENDFFTNFEENFLNMDIDEQTLDGILKSPKGKAVINDIMNSPKGKAMMQSPKGKVLKDKLHYLESSGCRVNKKNNSPSVTVLTASDPNKMSATPIKPDLRASQKMSKRRLAMSASKENLDRLTISPGLYTFSKHTEEEENIPGPLELHWPETERLKFARDQFKLTLDRALQKMSKQHQSNTKSQVIKKTIKGKSVKYPELSQALSRPSGQSKTGQLNMKGSRKNVSLSFVPLSSVYDDDEEDDDDDDWDGDIPFMPSQRKRKSSTAGAANKKRRK